jgi:predicted nucleic acid-binding protein
VKHLSKLSAHARVFVDTNIFVLHFTDKGPLGQVCRDFFVRTVRQEVQGFTSVGVATETIHRLMVAEAVVKFSLVPREAVEYLQKHPEVVQQLSQHLTVASDISRLGIKILPMSYKDVHGSKSVRSRFGLMANDSLIVAVMGSNKLRHIVTHDAGFERVAGIQVWGLRE